MDASRLADVPELVGFFSYSREDDEDSKGALSRLREGMYRELRQRLGRPSRGFKLWQDKQHIAPGKLWEYEIRSAIAEAVFFIPIVTPSALNSEFCRTEFDLFLDRQKTLGRNDLIFPILYIDVPELEKGTHIPEDSVLSLIAARQYVNWCDLRHRDVDSEKIKIEISDLCAKIVHTLRQPSPVDKAKTTVADTLAAKSIPPDPARHSDQMMSADNLPTLANTLSEIRVGKKFQPPAIFNTFFQIKWWLGTAVLAAALLSLIFFLYQPNPGADAVQWTPISTGTYLVNETEQPVATYAEPDARSAHKLTIDPHRRYPAVGEDVELRRGLYHQESWIRLQIWSSGDFAYVLEKDVKIAGP